MQSVPWEASCVHELDLTSTELSEETLESVLLRMPGFTYLGLGYCEFFSDKVRLCLMLPSATQCCIYVSLLCYFIKTERWIVSYFSHNGKHLAEKC